MDKKFTRKQIEQIIYEEMVKEGFLDRVMAKSKGNTSALKAFGQRGLQAVKLATTGQVDISKIQDPKLVKMVTMAVHRIKGYEGKFAKLLQDFTVDLETMFGGDLGKAPQIKSALNQLDDAATSFAQQISNISKDIQAKVTQGKEAPNAAPDIKQNSTPPIPSPRKISNNSDTEL